MDEVHLTTTVQPKWLCKYYTKFQFLKPVLIDLYFNDGFKYFIGIIFFFDFG